MLGAIVDSQSKKALGLKGSRAVEGLSAESPFSAPLHALYPVSTERVSVQKDALIWGETMAYS